MDLEFEIKFSLSFSLFLSCYVFDICYGVFVHCGLRLRGKKEKKKGLSYEPACISMRTHFCRIALCAEPSFWLFFFFFLVAGNKLAGKRQKEKKKWAKTLEKKKNSHVSHCSFSKKKKKKSIALSFFGKSL